MKLFKWTKLYNQPHTDQGPVFNTLWIHNLREMDRFCSKLVSSGIEQNILTETNKHNSLN
jgi:hypothetical protein